MISDRKFSEKSYHFSKKDEENKRISELLNADYCYAAYDSSSSSCSLAPSFAPSICADNPVSCLL